jgi:ABC-type transport system involved in multi-copper enzyme maturation permease subunit
MIHSEQLPNTWRVAKAVGWVTFLEVLRDKILYNTLICSILLFGIGILASRLTFIQPERIILDFGYSAVSLSCAAVAILISSGMMIREFERRTIYVALCHPISRVQFILGKYLGVAGVLLLNWVLLSGVYLALLGLSSVEGSQLISTSLIVGLGLALLQSLILASLALFFSTFSTTSLSVMISIGLYLIGNTATQIRVVAGRIHSMVGSYFLNLISLIVPNFELFNFGKRITYALPVSWEFVSLSVIYGVFMIATLLVLSGFLIRGREV